MVAKAIALFLGSECQLIELDNFQLDRKEKLNSAAGYDTPRNFGCSQAAEAIKKLKSRQKADIPLYNYTAGGKLGSISIAPPRIIVSEGLFASYGALHELADMTVYVQSSLRERLLRRLLRNRYQRYRSAPADSILSFLSTLPAHRQYVAPQKLHSDFTVSSSFCAHYTIKSIQLKPENPLTSSHTELEYKLGAEAKWHVSWVKGRLRSSIVYKGSEYFAFEPYPHVWQVLLSIDWDEM
jgi:uridine kinase